MDWDAIAAVGQAVSALALVIVIIQVRHTRLEMQRAAVLTRLEGARDLYVLQATNEGLVSTMDRVQAAFGTQLPPFGQYLADIGVSRQDILRVGALSMAAWQNYEASIESIDAFESWSAAGGR